ncbi:MAG TPA: glycosyltransferase family 2 protein [Parasegetibacter sp.]
MISICIPVYNRNISSLVEKLNELRQNHPGYQVEILVMDDASPDAGIRQKNRVACENFNVVYYELPENQGRCRIRTSLAEKATGKHLIFLDDDSIISSDEFLRNYLRFFPFKERVYLGGRIYPVNPPDHNGILHWKYGRSREVLNNSDFPPPFMTCNFLIEKELFLSLIVDNDLEGYGHEDSFIGAQLLTAGVHPVIVHNPVLHERIQPADQFLLLQKEALKNLSDLYKKYEKRFAISRQVRLLRAYEQLKKWRLAGIFRLFFRLCRPLLEKQLRGTNPSMLALDIYKLGSFADLHHD